MSYTTEITIQDGIIEVTLGDVVASYDDLFELSEIVLQKVVESSDSCVLMDARSAQFLFDTHDILLLAEHLDNSLVQTMGLKVATVFNAGNEKLNKVMETSFRNRSINCRAFSNISSGRSWLLF